jgi:hypothetical protein
MNSKQIKKVGTGIVFVLLGILISINAFENEASARGAGRRHQGPPPEAYTACEGKNVGDTVELVNPRGDTVTGTCEQQGDRLVLRPDNPKENSDENDRLSQNTGRRHQGPPPEAYTACEGKNVGDTAEFVNPRGDTVTGTCEQQGDRPVLRPDNPPDG